MDCTGLELCGWETKLTVTVNWKGRIRAPIFCPTRVPVRDLETANAELEVLIVHAFKTREVPAGIRPWGSGHETDQIRLNPP